MTAGESFVYKGGKVYVGVSLIFCVCGILFFSWKVLFCVAFLHMTSRVQEFPLLMLLSTYDSIALFIFSSVTLKSLVSF